MKLAMWLLGFWVLSACSINNPVEDYFPRSDGGQLSLSEHNSGKGLVVVFLSPVCPLCQNYAVTLNQLSSEFQSTNIKFIGVVSGTYYSKSEIQKYQNEFDIAFPILLDSLFTLANHFEATITPEVLLLDSLNEKKYQGGIDNWAISLGQKRQNITAHYLKDALEDYQSGKPIETERTKAVGCFIE